MVGVWSICVLVGKQACTAIDGIVPIIWLGFDSSSKLSVTLYYVRVPSVVLEKKPVQRRLLLP